MATDDLPSTFISATEPNGKSGGYDRYSCVNLYTRNCKGVVWGERQKCETCLVSQLSKRSSRPWPILNKVM
jgi:hypothetical protein